MVNQKGGVILIALAAISAGANGQEVKSFSISCGEGGHVSQHYEYDGKTFVFYTDSHNGKNVIREMTDPAVVITREDSGWYQFQKIRVREGRKVLNVQESAASMRTFLLNGRIDTMGKSDNAAWDNEIVETRLSVQFDIDGYVTQAFKEVHRREDCVLEELR